MWSEEEKKIRSQQYRNLLNHICEDNCDPNKYCILKEIVIHTNRFDDRFLTQLKCIEIFKYEKSKQEKRDIGWDEAFFRWSEQGFASKFAELFDLHPDTRDIIEKMKQYMNLKLNEGFDS